MSEPIIADRLELERANNTDNSNGATPTPLHRRTPGAQYASDMFGTDENPPVPGDFMSDLVNSQMELIAAQHRYMQDTNIGALVAAQHGHIQAQARVLERLRVFG